ncbi:MAG: hypothetical protein H7240_07050 [Glaciimonas sp.]|nr:hypothetical protein [Glaciimonas sp.]
MLQHEKRYKEAADQYAVALFKILENGLWWMRYGISLQSDRCPAEAQAVFKQAIASTTLSPGLLAFAEQKLNTMQS